MSYDVTQDQMNAILAMLTGFINESGEPVPSQRELIDTVLEVPPMSLAMGFTQLTKLLVRDVARARGMSVEDVWRHVTMAFAAGWSDDDGSGDHG